MFPSSVLWNTRVRWKSKVERSRCVFSWHINFQINVEMEGSKGQEFKQHLTRPRWGQSARSVSRCVSACACMSVFLIENSHLIDRNYLFLKLICISGQQTYKYLDHLKKNPKQPKSTQTNLNSPQLDSDSSDYCQVVKSWQRTIK